MYSIRAMTLAAITFIVANLAYSVPTAPPTQPTSTEADVLLPGLGIRAFEPQPLTIIPSPGPGFKIQAVETQSYSTTPNGNGGGPGFKIGALETQSSSTTSGFDKGGPGFKIRALETQSSLTTPGHNGAGPGFKIRAFETQSFLTIFNEPIGPRLARVAETQSSSSTSSMNPKGTQSVGFKF